MIDSNFFKELEKIAIPIGGAIVGGLTAWDINSRVKENKEITKLTPASPPGQVALNNPNQYRFEGGKHTSLKRTTSPHLSMFA